MRAIRRFIVHPVLPDALRPLLDLSLNLRWAWHEPTQELFRAIDPDLWEEVGHDPQDLLSQVASDRLRSLAGDRKFVRRLELLHSDLTDYLTSDHWYQRWAAEHDHAPSAIAYFSAEFGVSEVLPQYSGGLGILAGDHLKAASDLGVPILGVGLLYRHGYFRQSLNASGWQQERYPLLDPNDMPLTPLTEDGQPVYITVPLRGRTLTAAIWVAQIGRVPLLMLDSDVEANGEYERGITDKLYGGGADHRLAQEVLLGIGGVRAVREYCRITGHPAPEVYHANEGHAGFLGLERIREYMADASMDFDTALEHTRAATVFTTHTPVPAGIDRFPRDMVADQFRTFEPLPLDRVMALGSEDYEGGDAGRYNMAVMGLRLGQRANGVSQLHGEVSRDMFQGLWRDFDSSEVPIGAITNGVHHRTWIHPELLELLESPLEDSETVIDGYDWSALDRVDDNTIWTLKNRMRGDLVAMTRERLLQSHRQRGLSGSVDWISNALDPQVLTFGFARRGASYKRLTLMLRDTDRLKRLLLDPERPIQIVIAGKSHPADDTGKSLIQTMVQFADDPQVRGRIVFLPDYDISLARPLYPGCDVWINNPLRPYEACGTSGMKAAMNGAANLSIRDGWWDELYHPDWGWEIPSAEGILDPDQRDEYEANSLYEIIENEIVPRFYTRDAHGLPSRWIQMVRDTISGLAPKVLASRMVRDYVTELYSPAAASAARAEVEGFAESLAAWKRQVRGAWSQVRVEHVENLTAGAVDTDADLDVAATVRLGDLRPEDVEVQVVSGTVDSDDQLHDVRIHVADQYTDIGDGLLRYEVKFPVHQTGSVGYTLRVVPKHEGLVSVAEMGLAVLPAG
ncbi:alpha-glucan family phosphorylase [Enemella sp. A6]|uniref:alpha-glucan family phosphorylase n=1 Tax=Enemella sp. A6 TaxID=3440152 RepID=UPI003EB795B6